jgi:hypothetical protein
MLKNDFNFILYMLVGHHTERWWWRIISAVINTILFQTGDVKLIGRFPIGWGFHPERIGTDGFGDATCPTKWQLEHLGINICEL